MFRVLDRFYSRISAKRSLAGIYFELRTLRQMAEIWFENASLPLPRDVKAAIKSSSGLSESDQLPPDVELTEEEMAAREAERVQRALLERRDPGTSWRPDPER